ncbi:MAG: Obg family GTPase CgtA, partial [Clostridia bacterium]|nr:Obg family GTPase CgtA [Clostridia bacterium]
EDFEAIRRELALYNPALSQRPQVVAGNKTDMAEDTSAFEAYMQEQGFAYFPISAATGAGVDALMNHVASMLDMLPPMPIYEAEYMEEEEMDETAFSIVQHDGLYEVEGPYVDKLLRGINFGDDDSIRYFQRAIKARGIIEALREAGAGEGDTVLFGEMEFDFVD